MASTKVHKQHREEVVWPLLSSSQRVSGEITEWTIGLSALHVIPNMLSDKNGIRALSAPSEASEDAIARVCAFLCV